MNTARLFNELYTAYGPQGWWPLTLLDTSRIPLTARSHRAHGVVYGIPWRRLSAFHSCLYDPYFDIATGALLTQNAAWHNAALSLENLAKRKLLTPRALARAPRALLERLVRPSGYFRQKARKMRIFARHICTAHKGDTRGLFRQPLKDARAELLALWGVGPETADSILLYAGNMPICVVDAYTKRLCATHGVIRADYDAYQKLFMKAPVTLPRGIRTMSAYYREFHALIVAWGKNQHKERYGT